MFDFTTYYMKNYVQSLSGIVKYALVKFIHKQQYLLSWS